MDTRPEDMGPGGTEVICAEVFKSIQNLVWMGTIEENAHKSIIEIVKM